MGRKVKKKLIEGFSLVELSVVLAIIGLLAGGIVAGQVLIKNARLTKMGATLNSLKQAYNQFKSQYEYPPGDFPQATTVWGRADTGATAGNCANPYGNNTYPNGTCNGDGNGYNDPPLVGYENPRGWQQLRLAGLINGNYTGNYSVVGGPTAEVTNPGFPEYNPEAFAGFDAVSYWCGNGIVKNCTQAPDGNYTGSINYESMWITSTVQGGGPALVPQDAYSIDKKSDDGLPDSGKIRSMKMHNCSVAGQYDVTRNSFECALIIMNPEAIQGLR